MNEDTEQEKSDFGSGFLYPLALFLCHSDRRFTDKAQGFEAYLWLYGAADHLFEFETNWAPTPDIRIACDELKKDVLGRRMSIDVTWEECEGYIARAKDIFFLYDLHMGFRPEKARYS